MAISGSGGWWVRKLSMVCLHNNAIVARCILDTSFALWATRTASAPSILLVLLELHYVWKTANHRKPSLFLCTQKKTMLTTGSISGALRLTDMSSTCCRCSWKPGSNDPVPECCCVGVWSLRRERWGRWNAYWWGCTAETRVSGPSASWHWLVSCKRASQLVGTM